MKLLSFDPLRTLDIPGVQCIKPEDWLRERARVEAAEWILFPQYWQVNALVYGWNKRIFPSLSTFHLGHDKVEMTRAFQAVCPDHTPHTLILPSTDSAIEQVLDEFAFPFVAKRVRSSMGEGVYLIEQRRDFLDYAQRNEIIYVQEYLPISRDLRVVYVGERVVAAYWRCAAEGGFHNNVAQGGSISFEAIPPVALAFVEALARKLGVNHAGFDIAVVDGRCYVLEFNVRFGTQALNRQSIAVAPAILAYLHAHKELRVPPALGDPLLPPLEQPAPGL